MQVYEKRPSGLAPDDIKTYSKQHPGPAAFALVRTLAGLVLLGFVTTELGPVLFVVGLLLLASTYPFVRSVAKAAINRPALLLTGQPRWDGVRRKVWTIDVGDGDVSAAGRALAEAIDHELGDSLVAFDELGDFRGDTRDAVFAVDAHAPGQIAWAVEGRPSIALSPDANGVWLRIERVRPDDDESPLKVTVISNEGAATKALTTAAGRTKSVV